MKTKPGTVDSVFFSVNYTKHCSCHSDAIVAKNWKRLQIVYQNKYIEKSDIIK